MPWRWRVAGALHRLPEFRGRDRLQSAILGSSPRLSGRHEFVIGRGLAFEVTVDEDSSLRELFFLQFHPPALAPVLEEVLRHGDHFYDVGANIGIYSGWASPLVGSEGAVHAFEPVSSTRGYLEAFVRRNRLDNVHVVPLALGDAEGQLVLHRVPGSSGLTSSRPDGARETVPLVARVSRLDDFAAETGSAPALVKIDVEGAELDVLRGAERTLGGGAPPVVVFETGEDRPSSGGSGWRETIAWLEARRYEVYALTHRMSRARATDRVRRSLNAVALLPDVHREARKRLERRRFPRNQMT